MPQQFNRIESLVRKSLRARSGVFYTGYLAGRRVVRTVVNTLTHRHLGWVARLQSARWVGPTALKVGGWAYERGTGSNQVRPRITLILRNRTTGGRIEVGAAYRYESLANARARLMPVDYGHFGFSATLDLAPVLESVDRGDWLVEIRVDSSDRVVTGPFRSRAGGASAGHLTSSTVGEVQLLPQWDRARGLVIAATRPPVLEVVTHVEGRGLTSVVTVRDFDIAHAALVSPRGRFALDVKPLGQARVELAGELPECAMEGPSSVGDPGELEPDSSPEVAGAALPVVVHRLEVTDSHGNVATVRSILDDGDAPTDPAEGLCAYSGADAALMIRDTPAMLLIDSIELETTERIGLRLRGRVLGELAGARLMLTGPRIDIGAELVLEGERFSAFVPMLVSAWGGPQLAPQSGRYVVRGQTADGAWFRVGLASAIISRTPRRLSCPWFTLHTGVAPGRRLSLQLRAPLGDREIGEYQQAALKLEYHAAVHSPREAVYFESFGARAATCNPYALDREIARRYPDLPRYWGVLDRSVAVPDGAIPVLKGTREWWDARSSCRYLIINEWIRQKFKHQPFQVVLQTWHGSMFKRIGRDRPNFTKDSQLWLDMEKAKWDILLSQNEHSTAILRSAYAWDKPIWTEGYPRNDVLVTGDREPIRQLLGIRPDQTAVLYAPTWRDDHEEVLVDFLDLPEMARLLGDRYVILLRGHSRTLRGGGNVRVPGVIDVTSYPHTADVFLAADAMITDYSSVMFDFSVTGRPMIFFTPDLDKYRDATRGVYFDLEELAPGPVVFSQDEVMAAIRGMDADVARYAERYAGWRQRFNSHDDGHASQRVVDRLFALPKRSGSAAAAGDLTETAKGAVRIQRRG